MTPIVETETAFLKHFCNLMFTIFAKRVTSAFPISDTPLVYPRARLIASYTMAPTHGTSHQLVPPPLIYYKM